MSKNVKVNGGTYSSISVAELHLADGSGMAQFKDVDEITTPSGSINITANGTHDVTNYASAVVNVASEGGGESLPFGSYRYGTFTLAEDTAERDDVVEIECGLVKPRFFTYLKIDGIPTASYSHFGATSAFDPSDKDGSDGFKYTGVGYRIAATAESSGGYESLVYMNGKMVLTNINAMRAGVYAWIAIGD